MKFSGKTAVVTGAAQGIGFAIAKRLYDDGCDYVALIDIHVDKVKEAARLLDPSGTRANGYVADVGERESIQKAFREIEECCNKVDILINNAGITRDAMSVSYTHLHFPGNIKAMIDRSKAVRASKGNATTHDCEHQYRKSVDHFICNQAQLKIRYEVYDENRYPL